jgi:peptidyl-prolyl cis-trans isomerase C
MHRLAILALSLGLPLGATAQAKRPAAKPAPKAPAKPAAKPAPKPAAQPAKPAPKPAAGPDLPSKLPANAPFAVVNGETIPLSLYVDRLSVGFAPQVREALIEEALIRQEAKRRNLSITPAEVDATVARVYGETVRQYSDEKKLAEELMRTRGWTPADYKAVIREQARPQVLRAKIAEALVAPAAVTDAEIEQYYTRQQQLFVQPDRVLVSHILVRRPGEEEPEKDRAARAKAEELMKQVRAANGENFDTVARESSDDRITGPQGGRIPAEIIRGVNPYGAAFEAAVFTGAKGLVEEVIPTPLGFHIVRVEEMKPGRTVPLAEVRDGIRAAMLAERREQALDELFLKLRTEADVDSGKF